MTSISRAALHIVAALSAAVLLRPAVHAQSPTFEWTNLLASDAPPYDAIDTQVDRDGNVLVAYRAWDNNATSISTSTTWSDNVVLKLDAAGNLLWQLAVLPNIRKLALDSTGNIYVAGSLLRGHPINPPMPVSYFSERGISTTGTGTAYVARISPGGNLEWVRLDGGAAVADANALAVGRDDSYFVAGFYTKTAATFGATSLPAPVTTKACNVFVVKYAVNGATAWSRIGQTPDQIPAQGQLALGPADSLFLAWNAQSLSFGAAGDAINGAQLVRFNSAGERLWARAVERYARRLAVDAEGYAFVASDPLVLNKFDPDGALLWQRRAEAASDSHSYWGLAVNAHGDCYAAGYFGSRYVDGDHLPGTVSIGASTATTSALSEMFLVKYSASGELRWLTQTVGLDPIQTGFPDRVSDTRPSALAVDPRGNGIVVGGLSRGTVEFGAITLDGPGWGAGGLGVFAARLAEPTTAAVALKVARKGSRLALSWPTTATGFVLESTDALPATNWSVVSETPVVEVDQNIITLEAGAAARLFRLRKP